MKPIYMNIYEIKSRRPRSQILTCLIFLVWFSKTLRFHWKRQPFRKSCCSWEGLDGIDIYNIGNLEYSRRLVFINEECENLIVVNDGGELTKNINQNKKSEVLQWPIDVHYLTNAVGERIFSITMCNIVNHLGKHDFSCVSVVNNLKDRKFFPMKWVVMSLTHSY